MHHQGQAKYPLCKAKLQGPIQKCPVRITLYFKIINLLNLTLKVLINDTMNTK